MDQAIIVLVIVGFLMIAAEVFVPGLILGALGALCLITSVILCYVAYGPLVGTMAFAGLGVATLTGFLIWLKIFPHTPIGSRMMLRKSLPGNNAIPSERLVGALGVAITPLRPAGTARIGEKRVDVVAESGLIEPGESVKVVLQEGMRVVVRRTEAAGTPEKPD